MPAATAIELPRMNSRMISETAAVIASSPARDACSTAATSSWASSTADFEPIRANSAAQVAAQEGSTAARQQQQRNHDEEHQAGEPQALRNDQRRLDRRQRMRVGLEGLPDDAPGVPGHQREEEDEQVPRLTRSSTPRTRRPHAHIDCVDADVRAAEQGRGEAPGAGDGQRIARQLVGAAQRPGEHVAHGDVDADQHRGDEQQRAAGDRADAAMPSAAA